MHAWCARAEESAEDAHARQLMHYGVAQGVQTINGHPVWKGDAGKGHAQSLCVGAMTVRGRLRLQIALYDPRPHDCAP